jgi:hypothetical protein
MTQLRGELVAWRSQNERASLVEANGQGTANFYVVTPSGSSGGGNGGGGGGY